MTTIPVINKPRKLEQDALIEAVREISNMIHIRDVLLSESRNKNEGEKTARRILYEHGSDWRLAAIMDEEMLPPEFNIVEISQKLLETLDKVEGEEGIPQKGTPLDAKAIKKIAKEINIVIQDEEIDGVLEHLVGRHVEEGPLYWGRAEAIAIEAIKELGANPPLPLVHSKSENFYRP